MHSSWRAWAAAAIATSAIWTALGASGTLGTPSTSGTLGTPGTLGTLATQSPLADRPASISLKRGTRSGAFFDVVGRRSAIFGYEEQPLEVWVYPLKILDALTFSVELDGYPLPISSATLPSTIEVRPEATILTWSHAAFTVREILFAPIDEPATVIVVDIESVLPMTVHGAFRPLLRPMWPATASTPNVSWNADLNAYEITEESGKFAAIVSVPDGRDRSLMPYQEEPRDVPVQFEIDSAPGDRQRRQVPIVVVGSLEGRDAARAGLARLLPRLDAAYRETAEHYRSVLDRTVAIETPDARLNTAFDWARIGTDKGFATNPLLGTGLLAGFRTSGNSERPGFAWFFGRDALWTTLALTSAGDLDGTRRALEFLAKYQRDDGKIPHEISQSATLVPWFTDYPYAWASADATPLFVIAHADHWRATGDRAFLEAQWPLVVKAYRFSAATDGDGNGLIDNTKFGHGWVEGGALYPPHEEVYLQGLWIEASRSVAELADVMGDSQQASAARAAAERTRSMLESTYWLGDRGYYAFATQTPRSAATVAEPGPYRERRQRRLDQLRTATLLEESTVLPAVPMWWRVLDPERADRQIDHLGAGTLATDWGQRILSSGSDLYDPLSYHYGSVWPLFSGWASLGAYRYGRSHVGYQALMATALLTEDGALGYVTELLSGDFNAAFGRSSHHQIWSEAMVITPLLRGLLGIEVSDGGRTLRIAPQLPADWNRAKVRGVRAGLARHDVEILRRSGQMEVRVDRQRTSDADAPVRLVLAPALPLDARVTRATVNGRSVRPRIQRLGDVQFVEIDTATSAAPRVVAHIAYDGGSEVYTAQVAADPGARSRGLRILRSRADETSLRLMLEGVPGQRYELGLRSPRSVVTVEGGEIERRDGSDPTLIVTFDGDVNTYVRKQVAVRFRN